MICIGKAKELDRAKHLPMNVVKKIAELVEILDNEYGFDRDVNRDLGGYVTVLEQMEDIKQLKKSQLDIEAEIPEWVDEVVVGSGVWIIALFILSNDYSIIVVTNVDTIDLRGKG